MDYIVAVHNGGEPVLGVSVNGTVLLPTDEKDRAFAFAALTDALALLAGVTQQCSIASTAIDEDQCGSKTEPNRGAPKACDVVHLAERRGNQTAPT